ncbi:MAG: hypothetical protein ACE5PT_12325 [Gemmatimonadales bacterium]
MASPNSAYRFRCECGAERYRPVDAVVIGRRVLPVSEKLGGQFFKCERCGMWWVGVGYRPNMKWTDWLRMNRVPVVAESGRGH